MKLRQPYWICAGKPASSAMVNTLLLESLDLYRAVRSALLPPTCRFLPSCSAYARESLERYPLRRAAPQILRRLLRCHPFHPGGHDPVI